MRLMLRLPLCLNTSNYASAVVDQWEWRRSDTHQRAVDLRLGLGILVTAMT
eukprot:COSAG02_NODE_346_length_24113_cov_13.213001_12_plen_51_part_00